MTEKKFIAVGQRLKELRGTLSQKEMAIRFNMHVRAYQNYESGSRMAPMPVLTEIANAYRKSVDWILTGKEVDLDRRYRRIDAEYKRGMNDLFMHISGRGKKRQRPQKGGAEEEEFVFIPHVAGRIAAGGGLIPDNKIQMRVAFRRDWIQRKGNPQKMSLIKVSGDSMADTLRAGDIVLVDHSRNYLGTEEGIYAITLDDEIRIKRLQAVAGRGKIKVISDNKRYEPFEVDAEKVTINGKVIWFARDLERE